MSIALKYLYVCYVHMPLCLDAHYLYTVPGLQTLLDLPETAVLRRLMPFKVLGTEPRSS